MVHSISILGSTGSIGRQTVAVAEHLGLNVRALTTNRNIQLAEEQARRLHPAFVAVTDEASAKALRIALADTDIAVGSGENALCEAAVISDTDAVVTAVSGAVGLRPTLAAIEKGRRIALANKETLVCAGDIVMRRARECGAEIVPVDSEHSAIFQCLTGREGELRKILLTGSGGPFRGWTREQTRDVTPVSSLEVGWQRFFASGKQPELIGNRYASAFPYDSFQASDGRFVIGCGNDKLFTLLCTKALDRADLLEDPRFDTNIHRCENYAALKPEIEKWSSQHTIADCVAIIDAAGVPVAPINMLADVVNDDHIANAREMFVHLQHPVIGDMIVPGNPVKLMDTKPEITKCAPDLGQDNKEIYEGVLGLSDADLARLKEEKVI